MAIYYPPLNFRFKVQFLGSTNLIPGIPDLGFQEVSGLDATMATTDYEEGGENRFTHRLPGRFKYSNLVLKRGLLPNSQAVQQFILTIESYQLFKTNILVWLENENNIPIQAWFVSRAYPVSWKFDKLDAMDGKIFTETLEFAYARYHTIQNPVDALKAFF